MRSIYPSIASQSCLLSRTLPRAKLFASLPPTLPPSFTPHIIARLRGVRHTMDDDPVSPSARPSILEAGRQASDPTSMIPDIDGASPSSWGHIQMAEPQRPQLLSRHTMRGESTKSISEALRLARSREEQETLLDEGEEADDDGCYPPRKNDEPRAPNPHSSLPVYTTIHKIRRLIIACIGRLHLPQGVCGG